MILIYFITNLYLNLDTIVCAEYTQAQKDEITLRSYKIWREIYPQYDESIRLTRLKNKLLIAERMLQGLGEKNASHLKPKFQFFSPLRDMETVWFNHGYFKFLTGQVDNRNPEELHYKLTSDDCNLIADIVLSSMTIEAKFNALLGVISFNQERKPFYNINLVSRNEDETDEKYYSKLNLSQNFTNYAHADLAMLSMIVGKTLACLLQFYLLIPENLNFNKKDIIIYLGELKFEIAHFNSGERLSFDGTKNPWVVNEKQLSLMLEIYLEKICSFDEKIKEAFIVRLQFHVIVEGNSERLSLNAIERIRFCDEQVKDFEDLPKLLKRNFWSLSYTRISDYFIAYIYVILNM